MSQPQRDKRIFDIVFSSATGLILLVPVLIPIALLVKLTSRGPVFFKQRRIGMDRKEFICYKFRTMKRERCQQEMHFPVYNPNDITKLGKFLRQTGLDELPQLINVIKGDMSIIGPRPLMSKQDDYFREVLPDYVKRYAIRPGITGLAQVSGFRGPVTSQEFMAERLKKDLYYIANRSPKLDTVILFKSVLSLLGIQNRDK